MKEFKFAVAGLALLGIISVFLPLVSEGSLSISLWDLRKFDAGQFWLTMFGLLVPLAMGALAVVRGGMARWQAVVATVGFALVVVKTRDFFQGAIGGKLMLIASALGLIAAIAASIKPDPAR